MKLNNIKRYRKLNGYSQSTLAQKCKVSQQAIAKWEVGASMPRSDKLPLLARLLNCTIDELFVLSQNARR